jgi:hypothetical protein
MGIVWATVQRGPPNAIHKDHVMNLPKSIQSVIATIACHGKAMERWNSVESGHRFGPITLNAMSRSEHKERSAKCLVRACDVINACKQARAAIAKQCELFGISCTSDGTPIANVKTTDFHADRAMAAFISDIRKALQILTNTEVSAAGIEAARKAALVPATIEVEAMAVATV